MFTRAALVAIIGLIVLVSVVGLLVVQPAEAGHNGSLCKWDFPWPHTVRYWIQPYQGSGYGFTGAQAQRVSYGPATWDEGGFNLRFQQVSDSGDSSGAQHGGTFIAKGDVDNPQYAAVANLEYYNPPGGCDVDQNRSIARAWTIFNKEKSFHIDCQAFPSVCQQDQRFDIHAISTHETGHWFQMGHVTASQYSDHAMWHSISPGQTSHRTLKHHDINTAYLMYGYR